jgi:hypothetical protein
MGLNLHATVRAAIQSVNPDIPATYLASSGYSTDAGGRQIPAYADPVAVMIQVQPPWGRDLRHIDYLNIQGTIRTVFLYSDPNAIVRVNAQGGDRLQFPQFVGQPIDDWLVAYVAETWNVGQNALNTFSGVATLAGNLLTVTAVNLGFLNLGDVVADQNEALPINTEISALGTGTGGVGTYTLSHPAASAQSDDTIIVTDTRLKSGWSKLYVTLQTDRPS